MLPPSPQPFRFLDLPPELRLMVYERIQPKTSYRVFHRNAPLALAAHKDIGNDTRKITLVVRSIDLSILVTCRQVYTEANPIIQPMLQDLAIDPVRLIADAGGISPAFHSRGLFLAGLIEAGILWRDSYPESPLLGKLEKMLRGTPWLSSCDAEPDVLSFITKLSSVLSRVHRFRLQGPRGSRHIELAVNGQLKYPISTDFSILKHFCKAIGMPMAIRMRSGIPAWLLVRPTPRLQPEVLLLTEPYEDDWDRLSESGGS